MQNAVHCALRTASGKATPRSQSVPVQGCARSSNSLRKHHASRSLIKATKQGATATATPATAQATAITRTIQWSQSTQAIQIKPKMNA